MPVLVCNLHFEKLQVKSLQTLRNDLYHHKSITAKQKKRHLNKKKSLLTEIKILCSCINFEITFNLVTEGTESVLSISTHENLRLLL